MGHDVPANRLEELYFASPVVSAKKLESATQLLRIFAEHLAILREIGVEAVPVRLPADLDGLSGLILFLVFKAIEDKRLSLQDPLSKWFPQLVNADKITIEDLLRHRSGVFNFTNDSAYLSYNTRKHSREEMVKMIAAYPSDFEPGTKFNYSNSGFVLLTFILEDVFHKSYPELVRRKIIGPLHLKRTDYGGKVNTGDNEALPYEFREQWVLQSETDMSIPLGAGALVSTPADLCRFAALNSFSRLFATSTFSVGNSKAILSSIQSVDHLPLTPTLSLGERVNCSPSFGQSNARG